LSLSSASDPELEGAAEAGRFGSRELEGAAEAARFGSRELGAVEAARFGNRELEGATEAARFGTRELEGAAESARPPPRRGLSPPFSQFWAWSQYPSTKSLAAFGHSTYT